MHPPHNHPGASPPRRLIWKSRSQDVSLIIPDVLACDLVALFRLRHGGLPSDLVNVVSPALQALPHSVGHLRSVVGASNTSLVAADMIERVFDNVRQDAQLAHVRCAGSA